MYICVYTSIVVVEADAVAADPYLLVSATYMYIYIYIFIY